ncbi:hypothetical protein [Novosphingobium sp.]|uniref:hypothetical protein n=1 Tax=Novosphingobium sp. TaxID=1874826 RepID=UPI0026399B9F|nr:hypothetical protein [Novosphingobium sp.]
MTNEEALAQLWQQNGSDIAAAITEVFTAKAVAEGRTVDAADLLEVTGVLLTAAREIAKLADDNADGQRDARYAMLLRSHADAVELGS